MNELDKTYFLCKVKIREDEESKPRSCEILTYDYSPTGAEKQVNEFFKNSISEFYIEQIVRKKIEAVIGDEEEREKQKKNESLTSDPNISTNEGRPGIPGE